MSGTGTFAMGSGEVAREREEEAGREVNREVRDSIGEWMKKSGSGRRMLAVVEVFLYDPIAVYSDVKNADQK